MLKRSARLDELEKILLAHGEGLRVSELSQKCGVNRRTVYRDLARLREMGLPIYHDQGRYHIAREQYSTHIRLSLEEMMAFLALTRSLGRANLPPVLAGLVQKIVAQLPPDTQRPPVEAPPRVLEYIVLRFQPEAIPALKKRQWYPNQRLDEQEDGSGIYVAELTDWEDMLTWVRSWGKDVEVLAPARFRRKLRVPIRRNAKPRP